MNPKLVQNGSRIINNTKVRNVQYSYNNSIITLSTIYNVGVLQYVHSAVTTISQRQ